MDIVNKINQTLKPLFDSVDQHFAHVEPLTKLAKLLTIRPAHIILVFFIMAVIFLGTGIFSHVFVAIFGFIYPSYMTFKALARSNSTQCKEWLIYWIIFGFFTAFSGVVRWFVFFLSIRSYNVFRILFYVFLFHPATKGAALIYNKFLRQKLIELTQEIRERSKQE